MRAAILGLIVLSGCAGLRAGWMKVEFIGPAPKKADLIVCQMDSVGAEQAATCVGIEPAPEKPSSKNKDGSYNPKPNQINEALWKH